MLGLPPRNSGAKEGRLEYSVIRADNAPDSHPDVQKFKPTALRMAKA